MKACPARHPEIVAEDFPGYDPKPNPDAGAGGWTKHHRQPDYAPEDAAERQSRSCRELSAQRRRPNHFASFIRHAEIPLRA